ncbi:MAG: hypothetical protein FWE71_13245 [Nocardioidaceae bacterium]|nr:hypothetical protein [Nocardioidaceae bacterium]MCL2613945.1 hypothetical protein [Nocardioidaceae bacterium]
MTSQISLELPPGWLKRADPDTGVAVRSRPRRHHADGVPPEIVVRSRPVEDGLAEWRRETLDALARQLDRFEVEDEDSYDLGMQRVHYHRFGHRLGVAELITEQWSWLVDGLGVTLTCTVARQDYAAYCDLFEDVAATVEVRPALNAAG